MTFMLACRNCVDCHVVEVRCIGWDVPIDSACMFLACRGSSYWLGGEFTSKVIHLSMYGAVDDYQLAHLLPACYYYACIWLIYSWCDCACVCLCWCFCMLTGDVYTYIQLPIQTRKREEILFVNMLLHVAAMCSLCFHLVLTVYSFTRDVPVAIY